MPAELPAPPAPSQALLRTAHSCIPAPAHLTPGLSIHPTQTHPLLLSFFPVGRRHLIGMVMYYRDTFAFEVRSGF